MNNEKYIAKEELTVSTLIQTLNSLPPFEQWDKATQDALLKWTHVQREARRLEKKAELDEIDLAEERETFLAQLEAKNTRAAYEADWKHFEDWTTAHRIDPRALTPKQADDFIYEMRAKWSPATVRRFVTSLSSFYSFLAHRYDVVNNPFLRTRAKPKAARVRELVIPTAEEADVILQGIRDGDNPHKDEYELAVLLMKTRGFRVGALKELNIDYAQNLFETTSKGKRWTGDLVFTDTPDERKREIAIRENLAKKVNPHNPSRPFVDFNENAFKTFFYRLNDELYEAGKIKARYSPHSLRHLFACWFYSETNNIYATKVVLNHSNIRTSEIYLQGLGFDPRKGNEEFAKIQPIARFLYPGDADVLKDYERTHEKEILAQAEEASAREAEGELSAED